MNGEILVTFNAGSSTVKIGLFEIRPDGKPHRIAKGVIDFQKHPLTFRVSGEAVTLDTTLDAIASEEHLNEVLAESFQRLAQHIDTSRIAAIGHRVVHGGDIFSGPARIDDDTIRAIAELTILAPLHQPQSLRLIRSVRELRPDLPQFASFDTAFHRTNSEVVRRFAIPRSLHDEGIKRYGFHGLSYEYIAGALARRAPEIANKKIIVAHLGSGASLCALEGGLSRDTTMGFSTLDGIPMATRCGAIDPGVLLHLLGTKQTSLPELEDMLYHRSGLLGVSGISADSRKLLESTAETAREAIELFTFRIAGEMGRLAMTLGGVDALVFTAGIGENQPKVRELICARLAWTGLAIDHAANATNAEVISAAGSRATALVIPTDEEQVIADETMSLWREGHRKP